MFTLIEYLYPYPADNQLLYAVISDCIFISALSVTYWLFRLSRPNNTQ